MSCPNVTRGRISRLDYKTVSEFNLDGKVETCVHDNARNMESAGNMWEDCSDLGYFGHTLQLCLKPAFELPKVADVVN